MKIPNGKKHLVWARIAKTGSTSTLKALEKQGVVLYIHDVLRRKKTYEPDKNIVYVHELDDLKKMGIDINDCFVFTITRNPYKRAFSGFHYHGSFNVAKGFLNTLKNLPYCPPEKRSPGKNSDLYSSWMHLTKTMTQCCTCNGNFKVDHVMKLENYQEDFPAFCEMIEIENPTLFTEKTNPQKGYSELTISREEKDEINKLFAEDFKNFDYDME